MAGCSVQYQLLSLSRVWTNPNRPFGSQFHLRPTSSGIQLVSLPVYQLKLILLLGFDPTQIVMFSLRLCGQRPFSKILNSSSPPRLINLQHLTRIRHPRNFESRCLQRCYAQSSKKPVSKPNLSAAEQAKQQARAAAANAGSKKYGEEAQKEDG